MKFFVKGERERRRSRRPRIFEALTFVLISIIVVGCRNKAPAVPVFDHTGKATATSQLPASDGQSAVRDQTELTDLEAQLNRMDVTQLNCTNPNTVDAAKRCEAHAQLGARIASLRLKLKQKLNP